MAGSLGANADVPEYQRLKSQVDELVGAINGFDRRTAAGSLFSMNPDSSFRRHAGDTAAWASIPSTICSSRSTSPNYARSIRCASDPAVFFTLCWLVLSSFRVGCCSSDAALITSLRDGMNLVALVRFRSPAVRIR
jgi:hypothetical protein